ncbi:SUKH-4 immunity protein [Streptomyces sp. Termitarium-T10T-6]|nr:SUKH-4 immunity protein [Streptomyces sp. Termitarium-T10T-6]
MLIDIRANQVLSTFGLTGVTYFPRPTSSRMHPGTASFLATVGLPSNKLFSTKLDLDSPNQLECRPSLQATFDTDGAVLPEGAEQWEVLGEFQYATVALDPQTGRIYSFAEGEEFCIPMHQDVSSLVHTLTVVETGLAELKNAPPQRRPSTRRSGRGSPRDHHPARRDAVCQRGRRMEQVLRRDRPRHVGLMRCGRPLSSHVGGSRRGTGHS